MSPLRARTILAVLAILASITLLHAGGLVNVIQSHRAFSVTTLKLHRGDSVHFSNQDVFNHQIFVKSPGFNFDSPEQAPGETLDVTFPEPGVFDVQCGIHPRMHLGVTVD